MSPVVLLLLGLSVSDRVPAGDADWGTVSGQFLFDGEIPETELLVKKGDPTAKDAAVCAAADLPRNDLLVDKESKGIANIFVYMRKAAKVHPDLAESRTKQVKFDQKGCRFIPHCLLVRTDQEVLVLSNDAIAHNTHPSLFRNQPANILIAPNDRNGVPMKFPVAESLPMPVKCDIHPWMKAHWLILDHPYAAITDKQGRFKIEKLPAGDVEFRVWHERVGYVDRKFTATIKGGQETKIDAVKVAADRFKEE